MSQRAFVGPLALALAAALLAACPKPLPSEDAGPDPDAGPPNAVVELGTRGDGATFTPWTDGQVVPLMWGPQGGVMITPAVAIDGTLVSAAEPTLRVELRNYDATTGEPFSDFPGYGPLLSSFVRLDARLVNGPIFDQLGFSDMPGRRVKVRARVQGSGVVAAGEVTIVLAAAR